MSRRWAGLTHAAGPPPSDRSLLSPLTSRRDPITDSALIPAIAGSLGQGSSVADEHSPYDAAATALRSPLASSIIGPPLTVHRAAVRCLFRCIEFPY